MKTMTEREKLQAWFEEQKKQGLVDFKVTPSWIFTWQLPRHLTMEDVFRDINKMIECIDQGKTRKLTNSDFGEDEVLTSLEGV